MMTTFQSVIIVSQNLKREVTEMKTNLIRMSHLEPDFAVLNNELHYLESVYDSEPNMNDSDWLESVKNIMAFQDQDGSFKLIDSYQIESDARCDYCHYPTYICTAILIKAFLAGVNIDLQKVFVPALKMCCHRNLSGHGYDSGIIQVINLRLFIGAGVFPFIKLFPDLNPQFTEMIYSVIAKYKESKCNCSLFGNDYSELLEDVFNEAGGDFVFAYGTLMSGNSNHHIVESETFIGKATVNGYTLFDLGCYPGVKPGNGKIKGELYWVSANSLKRLDSFEGEGFLYKRCKTEAELTQNNIVKANIYVYLNDVSECAVIDFDSQPYKGGKNG